jgi:hypothetical protein
MEKVLITIDITARGDITCWTASHLDGTVVEDWRLKGRFLTADQSHTWEVDGAAFLAIRDILRYLTEEDWQPGTLL